MIFDVSSVGFVKRVVVGNTDPENMRPEEEIRRQEEFLNRCLSETPKGRIIGLERNFLVLNIGQHQVVLQYTVYHIGFARKPFWLKMLEERQGEPA